MKPLIASLLFCASVPALADELHFKEHGFSIKPLAGHTDAAMQQVVSLMLPAAEGFAANVNVQVQPFPGTVDEYLKVSLDQFKTAGLRLVSQKRVSKTVFTLEYEGSMQGTELHWYARGEAAHGKVYLATGTALKSSWDAYAARIKDTVDSLKLDPR